MLRPLQRGLRRCKRWRLVPPVSDVLGGACWARGAATHPPASLASSLEEEPPARASALALVAGACVAAVAASTARPRGLKRTGAYASGGDEDLVATWPPKALPIWPAVSACEGAPKPDASKQDRTEALITRILEQAQQQVDCRLAQATTDYIAKQQKQRDGKREHQRSRPPVRELQIVQPSIHYRIFHTFEGDQQQQPSTKNPQEIKSIQLVVHIPIKHFTDSSTVSALLATIRCLGAPELLIKGSRTAVSEQITLSTLNEENAKIENRHAARRSTHVALVRLPLSESAYIELSKVLPLGQEEALLDHEQQREPHTPILDKQELDVVVLLCTLAAEENRINGQAIGESRQVRKRGNENDQHDTKEEAQQSKALATLEKLGVRVYLPPEGKSGGYSSSEANAQDLWDSLAGYHDEKAKLEECLLLGLLNQDVYDDIARKTRKHFQATHPRAVLLTGPPGTGKTSAVRAIAGKVSYPLIYVPLESLMSKWYGESENSLRKVFDAASELGGAIIFLDEIDALATSRDRDAGDGGIHEVTRRLLSVLLRRMEGFEADPSVILGATNRPQDLDPALRSRFANMIRFGEPDQLTREQIFKVYAKHLSPSETKRLAEASKGLVGRDIRDICEQAERQCAAKIIKRKLSKGSLPTVDMYLNAMNDRVSTRRDH